MTETADSQYVPPKVWQWTKPNGGVFANINRPTAGARQEKELPVGKHPLQLYSLATPNGVKVTVMLEELLARGHAGAEYDAWLIRINDGEQFGSGFVAINPNSKIPALLDRSGPKPIRVFESGAILLYLAEKFGAFMPSDAAARAECLSWLFWQMGSAPFLGGGFGHFYAYAPIKIEYAIDRYAMEVKRQLDVLDRRLADQPVSRRRRIHHRRHGDLALVWRAGAQGQSMKARPSSSRCTSTRTCCAGPSRSTSARPCSAAAWSTGRRRPVEPAARAARRRRLPHQDPGQTDAIRPSAPCSTM